MILLPAALTGTTIAFPEIELDLGSNRATLSWILSGYAITTAAFTLLGGQLSDRLGSQRMFTRGMLLFFLGALLCTFSPNVSCLIAGRTMQGIGAAIYAPSSLAMVLLRFHKTHHALAIGIWAASVPIGSALSPTLASLILEIADWRWMFAVQTIGGAAVVIAIVLHKAKEISVEIIATESLDILGIPIGTAAIGCLASVSYTHLTLPTIYSV